MADPLPPAALRLCNAIVVFNRENHRMPTAKELLDIMGWATHGPLWRNIHLLEDAGFIHMGAKLHVLPITLLTEGLVP